MSNWKIITEPTADGGTVSKFFADDREGAVAARRAFAAISLSGVPESVADAKVELDGAMVSLGSFLLMCSTLDLEELLREGGFTDEADELRQDVALGMQEAKESLDDPEVQGYLRNHPEEAAQIKALLEGSN